MCGSYLVDLIVQYSMDNGPAVMTWLCDQHASNCDHYLLLCDVDQYYS